jgi:sensor histidine kinase regulating citrate/malate metabolism
MQETASTGKPVKIPGLLRTIRFRFLAWYVLILSVTFLLFSIVLYVEFRRNLHDRLDDVLLSRAEGVAQSINTYWEIEKMEGLKRAPERTCSPR